MAAFSGNGISARTSLLSAVPDPFIETRRASTGSTPGASSQGPSREGTPSLSQQATFPDRRSSAAAFGVYGRRPNTAQEGKYGMSAAGQPDDQAVVRNRRGNVLTRGLILKTDHFAAGGRSPQLSIHLQGAPNFRKASLDLGVYGVAQPSITGLKTILAVLGCQPKNCEFSNGQETQDQGQENVHVTGPDDSLASQGTIHESPRNGRSKGSSFAVRDTCVWVCTREEPVIYICGRPFVLRESSAPTQTLELSDRASNLEGIEARLKEDILQEATRNNGLFLVHEEDLNGKAVPTWIYLGDRDKPVQTIKEAFYYAKQDGWRVVYHRVPIGENQAIESNYLDAYAQIIKRIDPRTTSLIANCGAGFNRTTFAMVAALLIRRKQLLLLGHEHDPFRDIPALKRTPILASAALPASRLSRTDSDNSNLLNGSRDQRPTPAVAKSIRVATEQQAQSRALLRLIKTLGEAFSRETSQSLTELFLLQPILMDNLRTASAGDYGIIRQLAGLLDEGLDNKELVDLAIDACGHVTNLREAILIERVRYAAQSGRAQQQEASAERSHLHKALRSLERYFFLVAFASYVNASKTAVFDHRFAVWLRNREEIWNNILRIRSKSMQLYLFDPIADLSVLSKALTGQSMASALMNDSHTTDEIGDEFAEHIIRNRAGIVLRASTLLKSDVWRRFVETNAGLEIRGTVNFRRVHQTNIYATGQPTVEGIRNAIVSLVQDYEKPPAKVTWLNLREEPLVYINGKPFCLRPSGMSLRNTKAFSGISWSRLQQLEDRLKGDVLTELANGDNRLLLHTETEDGQIVPVWEEVEAKDVQTVAEIMSASKAVQIDAEKTTMLDFRRIPITAEKMPDPSDMNELLNVVLKSRVEASPIIVNDQLGRGRSTLTSVIVLMVSEWLEDPVSSMEASIDNLALSRGRNREVSEGTEATSPPLHYHLINSLLRVLPRGLEVKRRVDSAIDRCAQILNLREAIEEARLAAEDLDDEDAKEAKISAGMQNLRRYFELIIFQAYLMTTTPSIPVASTFQQFVDSQPVLNTLAKDLEKNSVAIITPLPSGVKEGVASESEEQEVISNRHGSILSPFTMLKSDFFPGILKKSLPLHVEGMPNLRGMSMQIFAPAEAALSSSATLEAIAAREVWGTGMPSVEGLKSGLKQMGAAPGGNLRVVWTSLREEPVLYVKGRPHVLRLADQPLTNVEATGISTEVVERMELALKKDILNEARARGDRVLLHDEVDLAGGKYEVIPVWEQVTNEDVLTPREVYDRVAREGYRVDYVRIAVTDEQAPRAQVFTMLESRVHLSLRTGASPVFNCQMGRGRTTTGMIIASLVASIAISGEELLKDKAHELLDDEDDVGAEERDDVHLLKGEWRSILMLVANLVHGRLAKRVTDKAIKRMEAVQNLRTCVYDAKLRMSMAEEGTSKWQHLRKVFLGYLQRYGYLIAFTDYLLTKADHFGTEVQGGAGAGGGAADFLTDGGDTTTIASFELLQTSEASEVRSFPTFKDWLASKPEIVRILALDDEA